MTIDEIMARLTPQEQQHTSPENVAAVLRVLAASPASIADTSGAKPIYQIQMLDEAWGDVTEAQYEHLDVESKRIVFAAPPAPSVADAGQWINEQINHKPGCDALGGYGHGVGPCTCKDAAGASEDARDAARYRWMRRTFINDDDSWPDEVAFATTGEALDAAIDALTKDSGRR